MCRGFNVDIDNRNKIIDKIKYYSVRFSLHESKPNFEQGLEKESSYFTHRLATLESMLSNGPNELFGGTAWEGVYPQRLLMPELLQSKVIASVTEFDITYDFNYKNPFSFAPEYIKYTAFAALQFNDGKWLVAEYKGMPLVTSNTFGFVFSLFLQYLLLLALLIFSIFFVLKPIKKLSKALKTIDVSNKTLNLPQNNTEEIVEINNTIIKLHKDYIDHINQRFFIRHLSKPSALLKLLN